MSCYICSNKKLENILIGKEKINFLESICTNCLLKVQTAQEMGRAALEKQQLEELKKYNEMIAKHLKKLEEKLGEGEDWRG